MATKLEVLRGARELLSSSDKWCQYALGITEDGDRWVRFPRGVVLKKRCLAGAVLEASPSKTWTSQEAVGALELLRKEVESREGRFVVLSVWNDRPGRTWEDIVSVLDCAIEKAERDPLAEVF